MQAALDDVQVERGIRPRPGLLGWLLITPMILWLAAFVVLPTAILGVYSFCEKGEDGPIAFHFTLENYGRVIAGTDLRPLLTCGLEALGIAALAGLVDWFASPRRSREDRYRSAKRVMIAVFIAVMVWLIWQRFDDFFTGTYVRIFVRSVFYAGMTAVLCAAVGYPVAYFIGRSSERWRNHLLMLVMIPFWTSFLIRTYVWIMILNERGLLNAFMQYTRLISEPIPMLYTPGAVVVGLVYSYLPFMILPIYGSVEKLDNSLVEAAFDLGAGPVRAFQTVILPLTQPGVIAGVLLVFIPSIGMFAITDLMGGKTVPMIGNVIQDQFTGQARDWPFGSALGMTLLLLFSLAFWISTRRQTSASVAG